jgi:tetratricopeptide (TPR) repeat protein
MKDPDNYALQINMGRIYWHKKEYEQAIQYYAKAVELDPRRQDARHDLAMSHIQLKQYAEALPHLEQLVESNDMNGQSWYWLGTAYAHLNRNEESAEAYEKAEKLGVGVE